MKDESATPAPEQPAAPDTPPVPPAPGASPVQPAEQPQAQPVQPTQPAIQPQQPEPPAAPGWESQAQGQYAYEQPHYPPTGTMPDYGRQQRPGGGKAVGALVCGILAILFSALPLFGIILGIVAIVLASQHRKAAGPDGKATGGKVCGIVGIVFSAIAFAVYLLVGAALFAYVQDNSAEIQQAYNQAYDYAGDLQDDYGDISTGEDPVVESLATAEFDKLAQADEEMVQRLAVKLDEGFAETTGVTHADLGVDAADLARWMLTDFSYELDGVFSYEKEATAYADVEMRDSFAFMLAFSEATAEFSTSDEAATLSDEEAKARLGELYMQALDETTDMTSYYAAVYFDLEDGEWVLDQDAWDDELDIMFMIY